MELYFDNAATTRVSKGAADGMLQCLRDNYGNPSSLHNKGLRAEKAVEEARGIIAGCMKVDKTDIYFNSGGTEGNNMVIHGVVEAYKRNGRHILISDIEHASVKDVALHYQSMGYDVETIPVNQYGYIDMNQLEQMVREDTILVSIMHVNNEIGTVQPIESICKIIKTLNSKTIIHVDGVQSFGKYQLYPRRIGIDLVTISGHKIHGPKGVGALYVTPKIRLVPLIYGGNQQKGVRSGTENVPAIVGFGIAVKEAYENLVERKAIIQEIRGYCIDRLNHLLQDFAINSDTEKGAYHILNIQVTGVKSEVLLHSLEEVGVYVSTGSACSSNKKHHSSTLQALGQSPEAIDQALRISFCKDNTKEEVDYFIEQMVQLVPLLRRFRKK